MLPRNKQRQGQKRQSNAKPRRRADSVERGRSARGGADRGADGGRDARAAAHISGTCAVECGCRRRSALSSSSRAKNAPRIFAEFRHAPPKNNIQSPACQVEPKQAGVQKAYPPRPRGAGLPSVRQYDTRQCDARQCRQYDTFHPLGPQSRFRRASPLPAPLSLSLPLSPAAHCLSQPLPWHRGRGATRG